MIQRFLAIIALIAVLVGCAPPVERPAPPAAPAAGALPAPTQPASSSTSSGIAGDAVPASVEASPTPAPVVESHAHARPVVTAEEAPAKMAIQAAQPDESPPVSKPAAIKPPLRDAKPKKPKPATAAAPVKPAAAEVATSPKVAAASLSGRLQLVAGARQQIAPGEVADGLVYFLPKSGGSKPKPGRYTIATQNKGFSPNLLVVPVGSTVAFPNKDSILHNVYSRTPGAEFNLDTYAPGESRQVVMRTPGLVIVNCNVHHNMRANIVVLSTPYYTRPAKDGSFRLENLPPGPGTLVFWHPRSNAVSQPVNAGESAAIVKQLTASKPRLDAHLLMGH